MLFLTVALPHLALTACTISCPLLPAQLHETDAFGSAYRATVCHCKTERFGGGVARVGVKVAGLVWGGVRWGGAGCGD